MVLFLTIFIAVPVAVAAYLVFVFNCEVMKPPFDEWDYPDDSPSKGDDGNPLQRRVFDLAPKAVCEWCGYRVINPCKTAEHRRQCENA